MRLNKYLIKALIIFIALSFIAVSCYQEPNFDIKPVIEFKSISKDIRLDQLTGGKIDSIIISINFKDGDGDLGIDTEEIGKLVTPTDYNYNAKIFVQKNGKFIEANSLESYSGFFPKLNLSPKPGPIEGTLFYRIKDFSSFRVPGKDTVKYEIYIKDRAGNRSNTIETKPIILNEF